MDPTGVQSMFAVVKLEHQASLAVIMQAAVSNALNRTNRMCPHIDHGCEGKSHLVLMIN